MTEKFLKKIQSTIEKYDMLEKGENVLVGLSGGSDSVCLLVCLMQLGYKVSAFHLNHCIRGEESDRDENFCRRLCEKYKIKFFSERLNVISYCRNKGVSVEEGARNLRYELFEKYADGSKIATAHNLSDNAETVIFNLTRGAALSGLLGIPPVRKNIVRPLIEAEKHEIEQFLKLSGFEWVVDSTNLSDDYTRNKIRHNVIPCLEQINPSFLHTLSENISVLRSENDFLKTEAENTYKKCLKADNSLVGLSKFHSALRSRCLAMFFSENGLPVSSEKILSADGILISGGKINIMKDTFLISENDRFYILRTEKPVEFRFTLEKLVASDILLYGTKHCILSDYDFSRSDHINEIINTKFANSLIDCDKIQGEVVIRTRIFGDKIRLRNRNFTSSVKKLINSSVPAGKRNGLCFIADSLGIVFAENFGVADRVKADINSSNVIAVSFENKER